MAEEIERTESVGRQTNEEPMAVVSLKMMRVLAAKMKERWFLPSMEKDDNSQLGKWLETAVERDKSEMTLRFWFKFLDTSKIELNTSSQKQILLLARHPHHLSYRGSVFSKVAFYNSLLSGHPAFSLPTLSHVGVIHKLEIKCISRSSVHIISWVGNSSCIAHHHLQTMNLECLRLHH